MALQANLVYNINMNKHVASAMLQTSRGVIDRSNLPMDDIVSPSEKQCPRCQTIKPSSQFNKSHTSRDGLSSYCKPCLWQYALRDKNPPPDGFKVCKTCQNLLPLSSFLDAKQSRDGKGKECIDCHRKYMETKLSGGSIAVEVFPRFHGVPRKQRSKAPLPEGYKLCIRCNQIKSVCDFGNQKSRPDGLHIYCKECNSNINRERRKRRANLPRILVGQKQCSRCKEVKSIEHFYVKKASTNKDGLSNHCKVCSIEPKLQKSYDYNRQRDSRLRLTYGISLEEYDRMSDKQEGKCAACGCFETTIMRGKIVPLAVDHNASTGEVRGLLCRRCNQAFGMLYEDPERIKGLLNYAIEHQ